MKHIFSLAAIVLFYTLIFSQKSQAHKTHLHSQFICSYYGDPISNAPVMGFRSSSEAGEIINGIIGVLGLQPSFEIRSANVPNAAAIVSAGKRYILYNPQFIAAIDRAAGDKWASIAILAHEIGHHLNGHTIMGVGSQPKLELEADEFSGFVLRKMGASLSQAQSAMKIAADARESRTHPAKDNRLTAIAEGWYKANNQVTGRNDMAKTTPRQPVTQPAKQPVASTSKPISEQYIAYDVQFNGDRGTQYYVTVKGNLVTIKGNQLIVIGRMEKTGNRNYPFKLTDDKAALLVKADGSIITANGKQVGLMKNHA